MRRGEERRGGSKCTSRPQLYIELMTDTGHYVLLGFDGAPPKLKSGGGKWRMVFLDVIDIIITYSGRIFDF